MEIAKESIFISAIRSFFNTLLGAVGVFIAIIPFILFITIFSSDKSELTKTKLEILPDLEGNMKYLPTNTPAVLQINVHGIIGDIDFSPKDVEYQLIESRKGLLKNNRIKAILLHINSPGGTELATDDIYRNLMVYKEKFKVPIYAYVDGFCASGGFYIACAAEKIYASPMSIIGSVGARFGPFFNFTELLERYGIETKTLIEGKNKDMMNPFRKWKPNEDESLKVINAYGYNRFADIVSKARNIDKNILMNEYGANIFDCQKAEDIGYIDYAQKSYNDALSSLLKEADIDSEKPYQVVTLLPKRHWLLPFQQTSTNTIVNIIKGVYSSLKSSQSNSNYLYE